MGASTVDELSLSGVGPSSNPVVSINAVRSWNSVSLTAMHEVPIRDESIRLGQFLKLASLIDSGADAKAVIGDGVVRVNGEVETRRGRQLRAGDVVAFGGSVARVGGHSR
jgi:ribosome-associated protein